MSVKNKFEWTREWTEEVPRIGLKGNIFQNRIFNVHVKKGKSIKFLARFKRFLSDRKFVFKVKAIEGTELLTDYGMKEFTYSDGFNRGSISKNEFIKENGGYFYRSLAYPPKFRAMFLKKAGKRRTNQVTFSLTIELELKDERKSFEWLRELYLNKELSDVKVICNEKVFECHKIVLSSQSDVFKAIFDDKSGRILAYLLNLKGNSQNLYKAGHKK